MFLRILEAGESKVISLSRLRALEGPFCIDALCASSHGTGPKDKWASFIKALVPFLVTYLASALNVNTLGIRFYHMNLEGYNHSDYSLVQTIWLRISIHVFYLIMCIDYIHNITFYDF